MCSCIFSYYCASLVITNYVFSHNAAVLWMKPVSWEDVRRKSVTVHNCCSYVNHSECFYFYVCHLLCIYKFYSHICVCFHLICCGEIIVKLMWLQINSCFKISEPNNEWVMISFLTSVHLASSLLSVNVTVTCVVHVVSSFELWVFNFVSPSVIF